MYITKCEISFFMYMTVCTANIHSPCSNCLVSCRLIVTLFFQEELFGVLPYNSSVIYITHILHLHFPHICHRNIFILKSCKLHYNH